MGRSIRDPSRILQVALLVPSLILAWCVDLPAQQGVAGQQGLRGQQGIGGQQEPASQPRVTLDSLPPHGEGQYVGLTKCAACHFDQYKDWKGSEHNKAFEILPAKYRTDASCLECHVTADASDTALHPFGVACESCHGPGREHSKYALQFVNEIITEDRLTTLRSKIARLDMLQCVKCHVSKAHKKHPPFDRDAALPPPLAKKSMSFFQSVHSPVTPENSDSGDITKIRSAASSAAPAPPVRTELVESRLRSSRPSGE